jgi:ABC-type antimicrobial peptide transport system permease subunit
LFYPLASAGVSPCLASYTVSRRRRELGIRSALGAHAWQLLRSALGRTAALLSIGSALGLALGLSASRRLAEIVFQPTASAPPSDFWVLVSVALIMFALGLVASAIPARRALKIDPAILLKEE